MATKFKKGEVVTAKAVIPSGPVEALRMDEGGNFFYQISWTDLDGTEQSRWFAEDQLTAK
jgi:uncharacterized protein YodC (DUF2158 family)